tara:strand:+ start:57 stop:236 length:180 start_codon:yes stop_codon:yes gene_type:complete
MSNTKLYLGIFFLFTGFLSIAGIGLIVLYIWEEYKKKSIIDSDGNDDRYISKDVIEEFR